MTASCSEPLSLSALDNASALHAALCGRRFNALHIDISNAGAISVLAAQVLFAAQRQWRADGAEFHLTCSPAIAADLANLGLPIAAAPSEDRP